MRFKTVIEYDGTGLAGWQIQKNSKTVQGEIESALAVVMKQKITVTGAGRTDAGVHARGQVAHFELDQSIDTRKTMHSLNGILIPQIRLKTLDLAEPDFHARYSAKSRTYRYFIANGPTAIERHFCWYFSGDLDLGKMNSAVQIIKSSTDFQSFCRSVSEVKHYLCEIFEANWNRKKDFLVFTIRANRFLHGMVRALVGTLVDIGRNKLSEKDLVEIFDAKNREMASQAAPARGLFLEEVEY